MRPLSAGDGTGWSPVADVEENDDARIVKAELPSVDRDDVTVELIDGDAGSSR